MRYVAFLLASLVTSSALAQQPQNKTLASPNGRYVFGQISDYRRDQYMLDTATGKLWKIVCVSDNASKSPDDCSARLVIIPYEKLDGSISLLP